MAATAAKAAECAAEQGQFQAYHEILYEDSSWRSLGSRAFEAYANAVGLALLLVVTGASILSGQEASVRDSAGVRIVDNRVPVSDPPLAIDRQPLVQIGNVEGEGGADFSWILSAKLIVNNDVAAVDADGREIRLFDGHSGRFKGSIGRNGGGPGEFAAAPTIAPARDGGIWAWDPGHRRLTLFSAEGQVHRERHFLSAAMRRIPSSFTHRAWEVSPSGRVLSTGGQTRRRRGVYETLQTIRLIIPDAPAPVSIGPTSVMRHDGAEGSVFVADPFRSPAAAAMHEGRVYVSQPGPWQLNVYSERGQLVEIIRSAIPRTAITAERRARERTHLERVHPQTPIFPHLFDRLHLTDSTSAVQRITVSSDGTLWVTRWHSRASTDDQVIDVLNSQGRWLGTVRIPHAAGQLMDVTDTRALTFVRDNLDVPYLRVYRLTDVR